ncbi:MAG: hypothetical protein HY321_02140 [Armatimonadetes bacterium]|nr:hypothetical protein [Armatimonadota bacterium]
MMLADSPTTTQAGTLGPDVHPFGTARYALMEFIADQLPRWRDNPKRKPRTSETDLTDQLCDHLNSAAYYSNAWSHIQFRTEVSDETYGARKIDLAAKPRPATLLVDGRWYSPFDTLLPVECKRLPTPKGSDRDEREYVTTRPPATTGGIQRFKFGYHGAAHVVAAMIAYVQDQTTLHWVDKVNGWIQALSAQAGSAWSGADMLQVLSDESVEGLCTLHSRHTRTCGLPECQLRHLWIRMH